MVQRKGIIKIIVFIRKRCIIDYDHNYYNINYLFNTLKDMYISIGIMSTSEQQLDTQTQTPEEGEQRYGEQVYTARVKWFNRSTGWGFLSLTKSAGEHENDDIFVHWKSLDINQELYKYLVNGEYVNLQINYTPDGAHSYQATNVSGVDGGPLMCETRHTDSESRRTEDVDEEQTSARRQTRSRGRHHRGPREGGDGGWQRPRQQTRQRRNREPEQTN